MSVFLSSLKYLAMFNGKAIAGVLQKCKEQRKKQKEMEQKSNTLFSSVTGNLHLRESGMIWTTYKESEKPFI